MENVVVRDVQSTTMVEFLLNNDFFVEQLSDSVYKVERTGEMPVYVSERENTLFFEVDLCSVKGLDSKEFLYKMLDLNTEILPVSAGIDSCDEADPRLVLVESRESENLDRNELLSVFDAFEIAADKIEVVISSFLTVGE